MKTSAILTRHTPSNVNAAPPKRFGVPSHPVYSWLSTAGWSSSVARRAHNPEATGSNPVPATTFGSPEQSALWFLTHGHAIRGVGFSPAPF